MCFGTGGAKADERCDIRRRRECVADSCGPIDPGTDLKPVLAAHTLERGIQAGVIVTYVGSLSKAILRYAGKPEADVVTGDLEIVSMTGTLGCDAMHIHLAVGNAEGRTLGGHVSDGCIVRTTAEIAVAEIDGTRFERKIDPQSGYHELRIEPN